MTRNRTLAAQLMTALAAALILTSCTADPPPAPDTTSAAIESTAAPTPSTSPVKATYPIATATADVSAHTRPDLDSPSTTVTAQTSFGSERVMRVLATDVDGRWLQVVLPAEPSGATGWVPADAVRLGAVRHHIGVDVSERTLVLHADGSEVLRTSIAVGTEQNPTPLGSFFVTDKLSTDASSAYGPYAFGLAAWSATLSEFGGGDGQIAIHGTDDPASIGTAASHGCIRVPNEIAAELAALLPLGVPVDIAA